MMKINWGTSIVIAFILFAGFILSMVLQLAFRKDTQHELVTENYYQKELNYQKEYDAKQRAMGSIVEIKTTLAGIEIIFPSPNQIPNKLNVSLYRPSDKKRDKNFLLHPVQGIFFISKTELVLGRYKITLKWIENEEEFQIDREILY